MDKKTMAVRGFDYEGGERFISSKDIRKLLQKDKEFNKSFPDVQYYIQDLINRLEKMEDK